MKPTKKQKDSLTPQALEVLNIMLTGCPVHLGNTWQITKRLSARVWEINKIMGFDMDTKKIKLGNAYVTEYSWPK